MRDTNRETNKAGSKDRVHKILLDDIRKGGFLQNLKRELRDIYYFYLDHPTRVKLAGMSRFRRWIRVVFWIFKSMLKKLTPGRRLLMVLGLILLISRNEIPLGENTTMRIDTSTVGALFLLIVLMLELKDKLLAKDELAAGRAVQTALVPEENPRLSGWDVWIFTRPANEVGGDLVDYQRLEDGQLGLVLGDVAGKGLGAALMMARVQASVRALASPSIPLAQLGVRLNNLFYADGVPTRFISLLYLKIKPDEPGVVLLNAGHLPPLLIRGNRIKELDQGSPALGLMPDTGFKIQKPQIRRGDLLLAYTDGITEARNTRGEFFGDERFRETVLHLAGRSAEDIARGILDSVDRFIGEARPSDDISMIVLKCKRG